MSDAHKLAKQKVTVPKCLGSPKRWWALVDFAHKAIPQKCEPRVGVLMLECFKAGYEAGSRRTKR